MPFKRKIVAREAPKRSTRKVTNTRRKVAADAAARPARPRSQAH